MTAKALTAVAIVLRRRRDLIALAANYHRRRADSATFAALLRR